MNGDWPERVFDNVREFSMLFAECCVIRVSRWHRLTIFHV